MSKNKAVQPGEMPEKPGYIRALIGIMVLGLAAVVSFLAITNAAAMPGAQTVSGALNFGSVTVGTTSGSQSASFTNDSYFFVGYNVTPSISPAGSDFQVSGSCANPVAIYGNCTVNVTFTPTATGSRNATLVFSYVDAPTGIISGTSSVALSGFGLPAPTPTSNPLGSIKGKVLLQGAPLAGPVGGVKISTSSNRQTTDGNGNWGYDNLGSGSYTVSVDVDSNLYVSDGPSSYTFNLAQGQNVGGVTFNLLPKTAATTVVPTTTVPPQTTTPAATTTVPASTTTTTVAIPTGNCSASAPTSGQLEVLICRRSVTTGPNGNPQVVLQITVINGLPNKIDIGNTVDVGLAPGAKAVTAQSDAGLVRTNDVSGDVSWSNFTVEAGATATLVLTVEAPPTSAGQAPKVLDEVAFTATDTVTGARYEGRAGEGSANSTYSRNPFLPVAAIPRNLPSTGNKVTNAGTDWGLLLVEFSVVALVLAGGLLVVTAFRKRGERG